MKIENDLRTNLLHKGVIESAQKSMKEAALKPETENKKPVEEKVFKNPEPSAMKGFKIDKLA